MTDAEHTQRHIILAKAMDELIADFQQGNPNSALGETSVLALMHWNLIQIEGPGPVHDWPHLIIEANNPDH